MNRLCLLIIWLLFSHASEANELVVNGGFESPKLEAGSSYQTHTPNTILPGWTVQEGTVEVVGAVYFRSGAGAQALDLNGENEGTISQTVSTTSGELYRLTFLFAGNPCSWCGSPVKEMEVFWGEEKLGALAHDVAERSTTDMGWRRFSFLVTGTGSDKLTFRSLTPGLAGPAIDQVSLVPHSTLDSFTQPTIRKAVEITFPTVVGKTYQVQWATEADATIWNILGFPLIGTGGSLSVCDPREEPMKLYRVQELPD